MHPDVARIRLFARPSTVGGASSERLTRIDPSLAVRALASGRRFPIQVRVADVIGMVAPSSPRRGGGSDISRSSHPPATSGPPPTIRHPAWIGGGTQHTTAALTPVDRRRIQDR